MVSQSRADPQKWVGGVKGVSPFPASPREAWPPPHSHKDALLCKIRGASRRHSGQRGSHLTGAELAGHCCQVEKSCSCLPPRSSRLHFVGSRERENPRKLKAFQGLPLVTGCFTHCFVSEPAAGHSRLLLWEPSPKSPGMLPSAPAMGGSLLCVLPSLNLRVCPYLPAGFPPRFPGPRGP